MESVPKWARLDRRKNIPYAGTGTGWGKGGPKKSPTILADVLPGVKRKDAPTVAFADGSEHSLLSKKETS